MELGWCELVSRYVLDHDRRSSSRDMNFTTTSSTSSSNVANITPILALTLGHGTQNTSRRIRLEAVEWYERMKQDPPRRTGTTETPQSDDSGKFASNKRRKIRGARKQDLGSMLDGMG